MPALMDEVAAMISKCSCQGRLPSILMEERKSLEKTADQTSLGFSGSAWMFGGWGGNC